MKLFVAMLMTMLSLNVLASDCQMELQGTEYCAEVTWTQGPYLNPMMSDEQKISALEAIFYVKGDESKTPVKVEHVAIYPWMIMQNGHGHGAYSEQTVDENNVYYLGEMALMKMMGYWELRIGFRVPGADFDPKYDYVAKERIVFEQ